MEVTIPSGQGQEGDSFDLEPPLAEAGKAPLPAEPPISGGKWQDEDRTFIGSDIAIHVVLFRADGHQDGRLVQIVIHDFHTTSVSENYRERQLTEASSLDHLQTNGINEVFQRFWLRLEEQRKKTADVPLRHQRLPAETTTAAPAAPVVPTEIQGTAKPTGHQPVARTQQFEFF